MTVVEVALIQVSFSNVSCKQNKQTNKRKAIEYHGIFMQFESQVHSNHKSPTFLLFDSWGHTYLHILHYICISHTNPANLVEVQG